MAWTTVENYGLGFSIVSRQFLFYWQLKDDPTSYQIFVSAAELSALADIFRNESPVSFNSDGNYFVAGHEPVGEGEQVQLPGLKALPRR
jgi:hypothetical protein